MTNKNIKFKKYRIPLISSALGVGGIFLFSFLTFIPEQAFAAYDWETRTLSDIDTMQQMNAKICKNTTEIETQYQLEDTRDGKKYWVAKLKDGNCWMTQNLAYDGGGEKQCDISSTTCSGWPSSNDNQPRYAKGTHTETHVSQGNFYSWEAAMNGDTSATGDVQGICPDKWQLPTNEGNGDNGKTFAILINSYNISDSINHDKLTNNPMYFQYSGYIDGGQLHDAESEGRYWSSTPSGNNDAYILYFDSRSIIPSSDNSRRPGRSVRCVAADVYPEKQPITDNDTANVAITVSPVISIDVTKDANDMTVDFTKVATSTIVARVGSNQPYKVMLSTDKSNLTNPNTDKTIPMIPSDQTIVKGTNSWGIKKLSSPTDTEVNESTTYSPVGINGNKALFYTSSSAASEDLTFPVAIAVDSSLPSGQYSTQVTLTAVAM